MLGNQFILSIGKRIIQWIVLPTFPEQLGPGPALGIKPTTSRSAAKRSTTELILTRPSRPVLVFHAEY